MAAHCRFGRFFLLVVVGVLSLLALACDHLSASPLPVQERHRNERQDRTDCREIFGTAFRSEYERQWFQENCSQWPLVRLPEAPPPSPSGQASAGQPPECERLRGRPYESREQREWFLANCLGTAPGPTQAVATEGDRTNCDEIRGTPYRSDAERSWYLANCPAQAPAPPPPGSAPSNRPAAAPSEQNPIVIIVPGGPQPQQAPPPAHAPGPRIPGRPR